MAYKNHSKDAKKDSLKYKHGLMLFVEKKHQKLQGTSNNILQELPSLYCGAFLCLKLQFLALFWHRKLIFCNETKFKVCFSES
jgi:hypothetical protein